MNGKVKWFDSKRGFGFISTDQGEDVFCHFSAIVSNERRRNLKEGDVVEFDVVTDQKGKSAENVRKIN